MACVNISRRQICRNILRSSVSLRFVRYKSQGIKVSLIGAGNKVGTSLAYLLKKSSLFSEICMHDFRNTQDMKGITTDLNNINTCPNVTYYEGEHSLACTLQEASIVVALDTSEDQRGKRVPCSSKFSTDFVFRRNAELCAQLAEAYAIHSPSAILAVVTNPVNSTVPLVSKVASNINHSVSSSKILGFTTYDVVQANLLWSKLTGVKLKKANVPVIGGSSVDTLIPLFTQAGKSKSPEPIIDEEIKELTEKLRKLNDSYVRGTKQPYAIACAINRFVVALGIAILGNVTKECAFVKSDIIKGTNYLAGPIQLGPAGIQRMLPIPKISKYEKLLLDSVAFYLKNEVKRGEDYAENYLLRGE